MKDRENFIACEEQNREAESMERMIDPQDRQKDEAIERIFKQVAANFAEIFEKLVPAGRGRLIIQRRIDQVLCLTSFLLKIADPASGCGG